MAASKAEAAFGAEREAVLALLALDADTPSLAGQAKGEIGSLFERLLALEDADVLLVLAFLMAETLEAGTPLIDTLGAMMGVGMATWWEADDAFLSLIRDRTTLLSMLTEIGGAAVAAGHRSSSATTLRSVIRQYLTGEGRTKAEGWVPRWLTFPSGIYVEGDAALPKAA